MRRVLLSLALGLAASCAIAQTAPSPADVGISKGTPDVFQLKGHDNAWTPFGSVDPSTHIFVPGTNGAIAPNDCVKWGPGLTSAGAACNSVTGGAHPANQLTIYTNHAGLVANVTTPTEAWTVQQQGFYAPGDGGAATYEWNFTSYCVGGTSGAPVTADGISCVLPIGQSASTAGRYLLSLTSGGFNVRQFGMKPSTDFSFDNFPYVQPMMAAVGPDGVVSGPNVIVPMDLGQDATLYYFSKPFELTRAINLTCSNGGITSAFGSRVVFVFPPGIDGIRQEGNEWSSDAGSAASGSINGCFFVSLGGFGGDALDGASTMTNVADQSSFPVRNNPALPLIGVGDGLLIMPANRPDEGAPIVHPGAYASAVSGLHGHQTITLAQTSDGAPRNYVIKQSPNSGPYGQIWDLPASKAYTVHTTAGSSTAVITGGTAPLKRGSLVWSDPFTYGSLIFDDNNQVASATVNSGGSGYTGTSGTMEWVGPGCTGFPVLNVTASGGVITGVTSVAAGGTCNGAWPPNTAANWAPGGGLSGGSGATFNTTWANTVGIVAISWWANYSPAATTGTYKLWALGAGDMRRGSSSARSSRFEHFPIGLEETVSGSTSVDESNSYSWGIIGKLITGADADPSTSIGEEFDYNATADIVDAGSLSNLYLNVNTNSAEESADIYPFLGLCSAGQNNSVFIGGYLANSELTDGSCLGNDINGNPNIGVKPIAVNSTSFQSHFTTIGDAYLVGSPNIRGGDLTGLFRVQGLGSQYLITTHATPSGTRVLVDGVPTTYFPGMTITDQTTPAAIPAGTTITELDPSGVTISNPVASGGVLANDKLVFSGAPGCLSLTGGVELSFSLQPGCNGNGLYMQYNGQIGAYDIGLNGYGNIWLPGSAYAGYQNSAGVVFRTGIALGSAGDDSYQVGQERMITVGPDPLPATSLQGDVRINRTPTPGGYNLWAYVPMFTTTFSANVAVGAPTAQVVACPSPALPAGTPIITDGDDGNQHHMGDLASCSGTTLTFQAPSLAATSSARSALFMQSHPAALIANDANGRSFPVALAGLIASLPSCAGDSTLGISVVYDGQTVAAAGYNAAVSTAGATRRMVFCDGTSWTYH